MSTFILVNSKSPKGDNERILIKTDWLITISESVNSGCFLTISEDHGITCEETIDQVIEMLESELTVSFQKNEPRKAKLLKVSK